MKIKMKKLIFFSASLVLLLMSPSQEARAEMDPRMKALGLMAVYGAVGGTLLGTASLAFGTGGRAVAKGASLGLYAGLLFGSYIVGSHAYKKHKSQNPQDDEYYPDTESSPYEDDYEGGGEYDDGAPPDDGRWSQLWEEQRHQIIWGSQLIKKASRDERPLFYMNFVKYQF